jgi:hypothetical protein
MALMNHLKSNNAAPINNPANKRVGLHKFGAKVQGPRQN